MTESNPYLQPGRVRAALNALNLRPSRERGQNFLIDAQVLQQIVAAAALTPEDVVIEVGPGLGALTYELVRHAGKVVAVELDRRLAARLRDEFRTAANLEVVQADVLRVDPATLVGSAPYKVVANLPYQITSAVLRHFLEATPAPQLMAVMVQREVAERIVAQPPDMSVLAHAVQFYAEPSIVAHVPAEAFLPAPKVASAVLRLVRRPQPAVAVDDVDAFFRTIKAGFLQARKKLANALPGGLAGLGLHVDKQAVIRALVAAGVDPNRRAETLTLHEWARVHATLAPLVPDDTA